MQPLARGVFETMHRFRGGIAVSGWLLNPDLPADTIELLRDGVPEVSGPPMPRPDLRQAFPRIAHAEQAGFLFVLQPRQPGERLTVVARAAGAEVGRITTMLRADLDELPVPPAALMQRVTGLALPLVFQTDGLRAAIELTDALARHRPLTAIGELLDWGCGCGRIARHLSDLRLFQRLHGCDIDAEAVAWCRTAMPDVGFTTIPLEPPMPLHDGRFDAVIGYSVFTHFDAARQAVWLRELRRVLAPGGLLAVTVHGRFALRFQAPLLLPALADGFFDLGEDHALAGIAPTGYYRDVFQTREWIERHWSGFELLEHREASVQSYHDLVVARRQE